MTQHNVMENFRPVSCRIVIPAWAYLTVNSHATTKSEKNVLLYV